MNVCNSILLTSSELGGAVGSTVLISGTSSFGSEEATVKAVRWLHCNELTFSELNAPLQVG